MTATSLFYKSKPSKNQLEYRPTEAEECFFHSGKRQTLLFMDGVDVPQSAQNNIYDNTREQFLERKPALY